MLRQDKERIVSELAERLKSSENLLVADYRGLTMPEIDELRSKLLEAGARFSVVKNTLTRLAAEEAGVKQLLDLVDGPTAIAFIEPGGDGARAGGGSSSRRACPRGRGAAGSARRAVVGGDAAGRNAGAPSV